MKKIHILKPFITAVSMIVTCSSLAQVNVTATAGTSGPTSYTTISDAFAAINAGTHQGAIDIGITGNTTEPASVTALLNSSGSSSYTAVTIHPVGGNWVIASPAAPAANRGVIELRGADNVTIDGDDPNTPGVRNLTIQAETSNNTGVACIRLSSNSTTGADGADNNTVKNCIIIGSRSTPTSTTVNYGINMSNYSTTSMTTGAYSSVNTLIDNNEIRRANNAVYANGTNTTYLNSGTVIQNNIIGSPIAGDNIGVRGIYLSYSSTSSTGAALIQNNDVRVGAVTPNGTGYSVSIAGIELAASNAECTIQTNTIHDVMQPSTSGWGAYGIFISSATSNNGIRILNNFIRDIVASKYATTINSTYENYGIRISAGATGLVINHNTIALLEPNVTGSVANSTSACILVSSTAAVISEFQNNILVNNNASSRAMGIYSSATGNLSGGIADNNCYYMPNGAAGYYNGALQPSLGQWQSATNKDGNSLSINPSFVSATDLHIVSSTTPNALESAGASTTVTTDIDADVRPGPFGSVNGGGTSPDIGADEFDGKPIAANDVAASAFVSPASNTTVGVGNTFSPQASFVNIGSLSQTNVPVRYEIVDAANTIIYNDVGTIPSIAAYSGTEMVSFTPTTIAAPGIYTIKAIAELSGDALTLNDTITGMVTVAAPLCGTYHLGASQPAPFNTLTSAVNALNTVGVSCPVIFLLDDMAYNEPNLIQFNQAIPGVNATNTVTVSPNANTNVALNGDLADAFIKVLSSHVMINGSNTPAGTSRNLTINNRVPNATGIVIGSSNSTSPVTNVTVKNCMIVDTLTHHALIIGNENGGAGYFNSITIENNDVKRANLGIWANAVVAPGNGSGLLITGNVMTTVMPDAIRRIGIRVEGVDGGVISNNEIANMETSAAEHKRGIYVAGGATNILIKGNTIANLGYTSTNTSGSVQGIGTAPNTGVINSANLTIDSNFVSNITSSSSTTGLQNQTYGISVFGSKGYTVTKNRIHNIENNNTTGFAAYGINLQAAGDTSDVTVANNFISDIKSQGSSTLQDNVFGIYIGDGSGYHIYHNSINILSGGQSGTEVSAAIGISSAVATNGPVMDIRNNIFSNGNASGAPYAIYSAVAAANNPNVYLHLDYNDYYSGGVNLAYFSGTDQADLTALQAAFTGGNVNSISVQPVFGSSSDLTMQAGLNGQIDDMGTPMAIGGISTDIFGTARPLGSATDMGAHEFSNTPTAITLTAITAMNAGSRNKVSWRSADETDGDRYVLERSTDGKLFSYLNTIVAKGQAESYDYWDDEPAKGVNYYRLKMYESNGEFTYSKIVYATVTNKDLVTIAAYPNPAGDYLVVEISGFVDGDGILSVLDISGRELYKTAVSENKTIISVDHLAPGSYFIRYVDDKHREILKVGKQ